MADPFPNIVPSSRQFTMGEIPTATYQSLSGAVFRRAYGNRQTGHSLRLEFKNIGDRNAIKTNSGTAYQIVSHYNSCKGTLESFSIPDRIFSGMNNDLEGLIQAPANVKWRYAAPPQVQSIKPGVSTVLVSLVGDLDP